MARNDSVRPFQAFVNSLLNDDRTGTFLKKALEAALAAVMEAEVTELTAADYRARDSARVNSRNGYRDRTFQTGLGTHELRIPKLRQGTYMPSFLASRQRSDSALVAALATCYHQGVSTRNVEAIAQALGVHSMKKSTVSAMAKTLDPPIQAFRTRELPECPYVFLDARYERVREDHAIRKVAVLVAIGVRTDGQREVLGFGVARTENDAYWRDFIDGLVARGLRGVKLAISDAHAGLRKAISEGLPSAAWQRCKVHFLRNLGARFSKKHRPMMLSLAKSIFACDTLESALQQRRKVVELYQQANQHEAARFLEGCDDALAYLQFPANHQSKLHSTNLVERINRELKRRTRVVSIFPNRASIERLVGALLLEENDEWLVSRRYISEESMKQLLSPKQRLESEVPGGSDLIAAK